MEGRKPEDFERQVLCRLSIKFVRDIMYGCFDAPCQHPLSLRQSFQRPQATEALSDIAGTEKSHQRDNLQG